MWTAIMQSLNKKELEMMFMKHYAPNALLVKKGS